MKQSTNIFFKNVFLVCFKQNFLQSNVCSFLKPKNEANVNKRYWILHFGGVQENTITKYFINVFFRLTKNLCNTRALCTALKSERKREVCILIKIFIVYSGKNKLVVHSRKMSYNSVDKNIEISVRS